MYNLMMVGRDGYWDEMNTSDFEWDRFLAYTEEGIRSRFLPVADTTIAELKSFPALFCYEFPLRFPSDAEDEPTAHARVGTIKEIRRRQNEIEFQYGFDPNAAPISMRKIAELAWELDIYVKGNENYRTHWAVKDVDLPAILTKHGLITEINAITSSIADQLRIVAAKRPAPSSPKPKVFIVHGRDDGLKNEVGRWLARVGLDDIILHEQPNLGRTLISKFQEVAGDTVFAVVIMTPDDVGGLKGEAQAYRARQNVVFELGFFIAKLGPERVAALVVGSIEKPSDYDGVAYVSYDKEGAWKLKLAREFVALGIPFEPLNGL